MPVQILERPAPEPAPQPKRWTREEFWRLLETELLGERYELIEGEIISKMGQKLPHAMGVMRVLKWMIALFGFDNILQQSSIQIKGKDALMNSPEPDVVALQQPLETFTDLPDPDAILLLVEVSETTLGFDLSVKADLYARSGVREYWTLDIVGRRLLAHLDPDGKVYTRITAYGEEEWLAPSARPEARVRVGELLPPVS